MRRDVRRWHFTGVERLRRLWNPEVAGQIQAAAELYDELMANAPARLPKLDDSLPRLPHKAIRREIIDVLREARSDLRIKDIHARVEQRLGREVSRHTIVASLSDASKQDRLPVFKVSAGLYRFSGKRG